MNHKAILPALGGFFFLALSSVFVKLISDFGTNTEWIVFIQYGTSLLIITLITSFKKFKPIKTGQIKLHLVRGIMGMLGFTCFVICVRMTNIVDGTLLLNSAPLFIPIIALIWLRKKMDPRIWLGIITGFIGIIFIIHPVTGDLMQMGEMYGVASGVFLAVALIAMKELSRTETFEAVIFYFSLISTICTLPLAIMNWITPPAIVWVYGISTGIAFMLYLFLLQHAYKFEEAGKLAPFNYSAVVFTVIFNIVIFNSFPDLISIAGIVLVTAGGIMAIIYHAK